MFKAAKTRDQNPDQIFMDETEVQYKADPVKDVVRTPIWLIDKMIDWLEIVHDDAILDPCAGDGRMMKRLNTSEISFNGWLHFDINPTGYCQIRGDLFQNKPSRAFNKIIMNPPFSNLGAYLFTRKCLKEWLAKDSYARIIAIWPEYALRTPYMYNFLNRHIYRMAKIPRDTFKNSGCNALDCWIIDFRHKGSGMIQFWQPDLGQLEL